MPSGRLPADLPDNKTTELRLAELLGGELAPYWLSAIIESADDAVISKTLEGIITSWNKGAERIFGYTTEEAVGKPVTILIPEDHLEEEPAILARLRAGERIEHYETIRVRKDGTLLNISLTVSPIRGPDGRIIGASKIARDITERKRTEARITRSEQQLRLVTDHSPVFIAYCDPDMEFRFVNRPFADRFGLSPDEVVGRRIPEVLGQEAFETIRPYIENVLNGQQVEVETEVPYEAVGPRHMHVVYVPHFGEGGQVLGYVSVVSDITGRKEAELALRQSEQELSDFFENAVVGLHWVGPDGRILRANRAEMEMLGYAPEEYLGHHIAEFHVDPGAISDILCRLQAGEVLHEYEARLRCKDGSVKDVLIDSSVRWKDGEFIHTRCFTRDVTERRRAEEQLREQAEIIETVNRLGQTLSAELDLKKLVQAVTDAATDLTNAHFGSFFYNVLDEQGESYMLYTLSGVPAEAFAHFPMPRNTDIFAPTFAGEGTVRIADVHLDPRYGKNSPYYGMPKGHLPVVSYLAVPVISRSGDVLGGLFFGHPEAGVFSERHERIVEGLASQAAVAMDNARLFEAAQRARAEAEDAAAENERLYREAQESSRLKDEFLATISHELRTPLTAILGWSHMLRTGRFAGVEGAKALETIERNARSQSQLIDDLLDVSRIITGKLRIDVRPIDPNSFIESAIEAVKPAAEAKGVRIQKVLDTGIITVSGDPVRLQQVIWNLLANAIKFTPRGERVQIRLERVNSHIEIAVSDTGAGISPEFLPHVFDRFRQADQRTTRQHGGMGLGLSIVRHLVEIHGGTVRAESPGLGHGSTFTVLLPVAPVYRDEAMGGRVHPAARDMLPSYDCAERLDGLKVLVVDDEPDTRELLKAGLGRCGAEVIAAGSAAEALEAITAGVPDLIISDIGMPDEDGYDLIRRVRGLSIESGGRVPAIALTAYARVEDRMQALRAGYQMHVPKPVELAELVAVAASLVQR
jgi:PAS domain S-box-containing protein